MTKIIREVDSSYRPLISVITVVYNGEKHIEQTILSIINQTYLNIEYIIIDGGSTDATNDIIKRYENDIAYWISESDEGVYDAMNKGIKIATGEYINFMNSGDRFYSENVVETLLNQINPNIDFFYGNVELSASNSENGIIKYAKRLSTIKFGMPFCHQAVFVKSELLKEAPFKLKYKISADYKFFIDLFKKGDYTERFLNEVVCYYDMQGVSIEIGALKENLLIIWKMFPFSPYVICHLLRLVTFILYKFYLKVIPDIIKKKIHYIRIQIYS